MDRKGSFLIEAAVAVTVLSVGVVTVMGSFAGSARSVVRDREQTALLFAVSDRLGALWAGGDPLPAVPNTGRAVDMDTARVASTADKPEEVILTARFTGTGTAPELSVRTYVSRASTRKN